MSQQSFASCIKYKTVQQKWLTDFQTLLSVSHIHFLSRVSLAGQEQQLQAQIATGCLSPRSAEQGVDIMQMLTKARNDYDKVTRFFL